MQYLKFKIYKPITHCRRKNILIKIIPKETKREEAVKEVTEPWWLVQSGCL